MFRVLSSEESHLVKKWRAPNLEASVESSNQLADTEEKTLELSDLTSADLANLRRVVNDSEFGDSVVTEDASSNEGQNNDSPVKHASLDVSHPSADMLQQSYDEGYAAGAKESKPTIDGEVTEAMVNLLTSLAPQKYQIDYSLEQEIVSLSKAIAKMILKRELLTDDTFILAVVKNALAQLPMATETPSVTLNPADLYIVQGMQNTPEMATLIPDAEMERGSCRVEVGASMLDAGIEALVNTVASRQLKSEKTRNDTEPTESNLDDQLDSPV